MLKQILEKDPIISYLVENGSLTKPQLDTLLINILNPKTNLKEKIRLRDDRTISKGSFLRTLKQAQSNIEKSLYTVILLEYLSILNTNSFSNLTRIGELLKEIKNLNISHEETYSMLHQITSAISQIYITK